MTNPYEPPRVPSPPDGSRAIPWLGIVLVVAPIAMGVLYGIAVVPIACGVSAFVYFIGGKTRMASRLLFRGYQMTTIDLLVVMSICGVLYGLSIPSISTTPRSR